MCWKLYQTDNDVRILINCPGKTKEHCKASSTFWGIKMEFIAEFNIGEEVKVDFIKTIEPDVIISNNNNGFLIFEISSLTIDGNHIDLCQVGNKLCLWLPAKLLENNSALFPLLTQAKHIIHKIKPE